MEQLLYFTPGDSFRSAYTQGKEGARVNRLAELSSAALAAPVDQRASFAPQIAAIDPDAGFAFDQGIQRQQQTMQAESERRLGNMAKLLSVAPTEARGSLWARIRPGLQQMGFEAPEQWDDSLLPVVQQLGGGVPRDETRPMVVAPGSVLAGPNGEVLFRNEFKPEAPDRGQIVNVPVPGGTQAMVWRNGQLEPLGGGQAPMGQPAMSAPPAAPTGASPKMDAIMARANEMSRSGVRPEIINRFIASESQRLGVELNGGEAVGGMVPTGGPSPQPPAPGGGLGFRPDSNERLATSDEKRLYGYGENDIVAIDANGLPKPIRVAEAPGAKPVGAEAANKVSLYDNALRAARQWQSLVVNPDGSFNDIASRTPQAQALLNQALRAKLRAESGASISPEEIEGETARYRGGLLSSDSTAVQQANALIQDLINQRSALDPANQIQPAISGSAPGPAAAAASPPAPGGIRILSVTPVGQ